MFASSAAISSFLAGVVERFRHPGELFLVGEISLVVEGKRTFCSELIVATDVSMKYVGLLRAAVDAAASDVGIAVAIEHPASVIPLPEGAGLRSKPVTGFREDSASLRIRHFDPYTTAIRFIARGDEPDYDLVVSLLEMGWIDLETLEIEIHDLLPRFSFETIQQDPAEFRRKYKGLKQMWHAKSTVGSGDISSNRVRV